MAVFVASGITIRVTGWGVRVFIGRGGGVSCLGGVRLLRVLGYGMRTLKACEVLVGEVQGWG